MTEPDGPLVLIVDDSASNRKLVRDVLSLAGFRTVEAGTVADGVAIAREQTPSLVLMDLRLPDGDGTDALRELRAGIRTAAIPVIALTAVRVESGETWLDELGFDGFIAKPIDLETFAAQVHSYCTAARR